MSGLINSEKVNKNWSVIYEKAIKDDGSYYFPERLNEEFLESSKKTLGSILFANQYLNEIFPSDKAIFKREWFKYSLEIPKKVYTFAMIDPAISLEDGSDYTGITVVSVDADANWYFRVARRAKLTATELIELPFAIHEMFACNAIGVESVSFQKVLIHLIAKEMAIRKNFIPLKEVKVPSDKSKEQRIQSLVPLFEWGRAYLTQGMEDFEKELLQFPRSQFDDISDSAASLQQIIFYPSKDERKTNEQPSPYSSEYERYNIDRLIKQANDDI